MSTERIVIAAMRPFPGKEAALLTMVREHISILRKEGLATDRTPIIMQSEDGTVIEVFGWKSKEAIASAHENPTIQKLWGEYAQVCEYVPIAEVPEGATMFSEFSPV